MSITQSQSGKQSSRLIAQSCAAIAAAIGLLGIAGWITGLPLLASLGPAWIPMAPSTALLLALFGAAVFFISRTPLSRSAYLAGVTIGSAGALIALALLFVLSYLGIYLDVEHLGFAISRTVSTARVGHMSALTALCFLGGGLSLLASLSSSPERPGFASAGFWLAGVLVLANTVFLLAYLFGRPMLYEGPFVPPALPTCLAFVALGIGLAALAANRAWPELRYDAADSRSLVLVFIGLAVGIVTTGYLYFHAQETLYRAKGERELSVVASLTTEQLTRWRAERLGDAEALFRNPVMSEQVRRVIVNTRDARAKAQLHRWLQQVREAYRYDHVFLLDAQGAARISVPGEPAPVYVIAHAREAMRSGRITFLDLQRDARTGRIHLALLVPVLGKSAIALGLLVLAIDPYQYLYPMIQHWPTPSRTAETLLVRRDGNDVLFLNELRFEKNTALSRRISLQSDDVPAVQAVLGKEGIVEGIDYRGVPVIASVRPVPDSPWFLVARIDTAEALAPVQENLWLTVSLVAALLIAAGAVVGLLWRHQRLRHYQEQWRSAEALAASVARHRVVTQTAADAIVTADAAGTLVGWNPAAARMFGYAEDEAIGRPFTLLMPERYRAEFQREITKTGAEGKHPLPFKTVELLGLTKAGVEFPLELSLSDWETEEGRSYTGIIRDITERRQAALALAESEERHRTIVQTAMDGYWLLDTQGRLLEVNDTYCRLSGYGAQELLGMRIPDLEAVETAVDTSARIRKAMALGQDRFQSRHRRKDGSIFEVEVSVQYRPAGGGRFVVFLRDITESKRTEILLRTRLRLAELARAGGLEQFLQQVLDSAEEVTGSQIGFFHFVDPDQEHLTLQAWSTNTLARVCTAEGKGRHYPIGEAGLWVDAFHQRSPVIHNDYPSLAHKKGLPEGHVPVTRELVLPIIRKGKVTEIIGVGNKASDYVQADVEALRTIAEMTQDFTGQIRAEESARNAHEQLRQLAVQLNRLREAESGLLSRELHDEFGQMLTRMKMDLSWLASDLGEGNQELKKRIASSVALVETSVRSVRSIAARLRPRILDELGLMPTLEWAVQEFRERLGIDAEIVSNTRARALTPEQATAVFRIVQESLANIARHASAKCVDVSLHAEAGWLTLEVRDDGKGIAEDAKTSYESIGLIGMRERALAAGGELTLESVPGKGTVVTLRLPHKEENA